LGKAPHKPLLLLCVSDLYRQNAIRENRVEPTLYIEESFDAYWRKLFDRDHHSTFAFPFFHLQHDGFWFLVATDGKNVSDPAVARASSALRNAVAYAKIDPALHGLLRRPEWNCHLRSIIIASNFDPDVHVQLVAH
jgi:putative restriction endonuclease